MDISGTGFSLDAFFSRRGSKTDYKQKLEQDPVVRSASDEVGLAVPPSPFVAEVQALAGHPDVAGVSFQCVAVAALQTLERVSHRERQVAQAALSLAQRQKLERMIRDVEETAEALRTTLSTRGARMLDRQVPARQDAQAPEHSWWFALCEAIEILKEGTASMASFTAALPKDGPTYKLSRVVAHLLHQHHLDLLGEAEQWLD